MNLRVRNAFTLALAALLSVTVATSPDADRFFPAATFILAAAYLAVWTFGSARLLWTLPLYPLTAMALWAWLPASRAPYRWSAYLAVAFLATQLFASARLRFRFKQLAVLCGAAAAVAVLIQSVGAHRIPNETIVVLSNRNHFAAFIELLLPIACWEFVTARKPIYIIAAGVMFLSVVMTASRMGILLTAAELLVLTVAGVNRSRRVPWIPLVLTAAATVTLAATLGTTAWQRFAGLPYDVETSSRGFTAKASLAMVREKPLFGFGLGTWESVYPRFAEIDTGFHLIHADNDWLEWAAEGGLPFIGFVLFIAALAVKNAWREPWSLGLPAVLIHSCTEFPLQKLAVMSWFVVLLAMSAIARRKQVS